MLDVASLEKIRDFVETSLITFVSDGRAFVKRGGGLGFLDLSSGDYEALKLPADLKLGWQRNYAISADGAQFVYASGGNALTFLSLDSGSSQTIQLEHEKFAIEGFSQLTFQRAACCWPEASSLT